MVDQLGDTIYGRFVDSVGKYPENPFLHIPKQASQGYSPVAIDFSYLQMQEQVEELRKIYQEAGYGHGHRVTLLTENRAESFQHFFALNALGVCVVPINAESVAAEMAYIMDNSEVSLVLYLPEHAEKIKQAVSMLEQPVNLCPVNELESLPGAPECQPGCNRVGLKADAAILYTSGTTGRPKGCVLSNEFFFCVGDWYANAGGYFSLERGCERIITPLPLSHTNALTWTLMVVIQTGGCVIQLDRFHPRSWWETVRESGATAFHYLGVMPAMLLSLAEDERDYLPQIKFGFGAGVEPDLHAAFEQRFGMPLVEGWSMTETGAAGVIMCTEDPRHVGTRCMGRPTNEMEVAVRDDAGKDVAAGEMGELLVRRKGSDPRYGFFSEYYNNPEATREAWEDGWFHTGDVVKQDEDGSLYFIERKKNIIRRSGENIGAAEVETVLVQHPDIINCAVAPLPDPIREEEVAVCVILNKGVDANLAKAKELVRYCLQRLSYFKVPGFVMFVESLPVTSTQKIRRGELRKLCLELAETSRCLDCREMKTRKYSDEAGIS